MPKLFGLDIASIAYKAAKDAGGLPTLTFVAVTDGSINDSYPAAGPEQTTTSYSCMGVITLMGQNQVDGEVVMTGDCEAVIFVKSLTVKPKIGDKITVNDELGNRTYLIVPEGRGVKPDAAGACWVCHVRGA